MTHADKTDEEILSIATPIMDNLMEASTELDWEKHSRDFTDSINSEENRKNFKADCQGYQEKYGIFTERKLMGIIRHEACVNIIWSQTLSKSSNEYLAVLSLVEKAGEYKVARCFVDLWPPAK